VPESGGQEVFDGSPSPPTDRVVAVTELLVGVDRPLRVSEIAERLAINRSTCSAILETLENHGWVERLPDLSYQAGGGLIPIANKIRTRLPILQIADPLIKELAASLDIKGVSLSLINDGHMTQVARAGSTRDWVDVGPLLRLPVFPPFGAVVVAFGTRREREGWLAQVGDESTREHLQTFLATVRDYGAAVWRLDAQTQLISEAIIASHALTPRSATQHHEAILNDRLATLLHTLSRLGFSAGDLQSAATLPISYIEMPVFDVDGRPCYELELHVMREKVSHQELQEIVGRTGEAAAALTRACADLKA